MYSRRYSRRRNRPVNTLACIAEQYAAIVCFLECIISCVEATIQHFILLKRSLYTEHMVLICFALLCSALSWLDGYACVCELIFFLSKVFHFILCSSSFFLSVSYLFDLIVISIARVIWNEINIVVHTHTHRNANSTTWSRRSTST